MCCVGVCFIAAGAPYRSFKDDWRSVQEKRGCVQVGRSDSVGQGWARQEGGEVGLAQELEEDEEVTR